MYVQQPSTGAASHTVAAAQEPWLQIAGQHLSPQKIDPASSHLLWTLWGVFGMLLG